MENSELIDKAAKAVGGFPALAERLVYKERTLKRIRSGEFPLSDRLRQVLERLAEEPGSYGKTARKNIEQQPVNRRKIPVYSFVQAGAAVDFETLPAEWEDTEDYYGTDPNAFALRVYGDSMEPKFPPGVILTVSPAHPPSNGQLVVAAIKNEGAVFKMFQHSGDGKIVTLKSYNPLYDPIVLPREKFHYIYRVVRSSQSH